MQFWIDVFEKATGLILSGDATLYGIVFRSVIISLCASALAGCIGIPCAYIIGTKTFIGKKIIIRVLDSLLAVPTVVIGLLCYAIFSRQGMLGDLGLLYSPIAIVVGETLLILPIITRLTLAALEQANQQLFRTLHLMGFSAHQKFILILSELRVGVSVGLVNGCSRAIGEVGVAMMLGGNIAGYTRTMTTAIALLNSQGEIATAFALGIMLLVIAFLMNGLTNYLVKTQ